VTEAAHADYPKTVVLKDGAHVVLRPMAAGDRDAVTALAAEAGARAALDAADTVVLACAGDALAGATLLGRTAPDAATVAVVLAPAFAGRRLGTWMLLDAVHLAAALGLGRLEAVARASDAAHLAALRRLDFVEARPQAPAADVVLVKTLHAAWTDF
jgi:GNAT superfamily N-acetyltransferase